MKRLLLIIYCTCGLITANAQLDFYSGGGVDLLEADYFNPSWAQLDSGITIGVASLGYQQYHSGASYRDLISNGDQGAILDLDKLAPKLRAINHLQSTLSLQTVKAVLRKNNISVGFSHELVLQADMSYPSGLVELYNQGNQPFIGETIDLGPSGEFMSYNAYAVQVGIDLGLVRLAVRPKLLFGHQFLAMDSRRFSVYTDPEFYQLSFDTDFEIYSNGLLRFDDLNLINYNFSGLDSWSLFSNNTGFAIDLGATMVVRKWQLGLGLSDIGSMNWKDTEVYESVKQFDYSGISIPDVLDLESLVVGGNLDSLRTFFDVSEKTEDVRRTLPLQFRASALYALSDDWSFAAQAHYRKQNFTPWSFALSANYGGFKYVETSLVVAYRYEELNVGVGLNARLGKFRPFLAFENILQGFSPTASTNFYLRAGINLGLSN